MKCGRFARRWHHSKRQRDRYLLTLEIIKAFPDLKARADAWQRFMEWPENTHWRCDCARRSKHPMLPVLLGEQWHFDGSQLWVREPATPDPAVRVSSDNPLDVHAREGNLISEKSDG